MAVALTTSKRKFNKLLDSLTSSSQTSLATIQDVPSTSTPQAKRPRSSTESFNSIRSTSTSVTTRPIAKLKSTVADTPPRPAPNYAPWNQAAFLARLKTFSDVKTWSPKPDSINEVVWAKRGWICEALNRVACKGGCEARLVVQLRPKRKNADGEDIDGSEDYSTEVEDELVQRYERLIEEGHAEDCLWRRAGGCREDIMRLPLVRESVWKDDLRERCRNLQAVQEDLRDIRSKPDVTDLVPLLQTLDETSSSEVDTSTATVDNTEASGSSQPKILTPALFGWRGAVEASNPILTCATCFQRIGLWLYHRPQNQSLDSAEQDDDLFVLDLVHKHREHCPWRNSETQCGVGKSEGLAGWEILVGNVRRSIRPSSTNNNTAGSAVPVTDPAASDPVENAIPHTDTGTDDGVLVETPHKSRAEIESEDKARDSRLKKLRRALSLKSTMAKLKKKG
ncbi:C3HC zinc finger-like-domain-containing protein [Cryomyces antarcticus]